VVVESNGICELTESRRKFADMRPEKKRQIGREQSPEQSDDSGVRRREQKEVDARGEPIPQDWGPQRSLLGRRTVPRAGY